MKTSKIAAVLVGALALGLAGAVSATTFTVGTFGDASTTTNGYQLNVTDVADYGGVFINPSAGFTLGDLSSFSFDYNMIEGNAGAGTPRIFMSCTGTAACDAGQAGFVYPFQYMNVVQGDSGNTGDVVSSSLLDAGPNGLGFGNCSNFSYTTFADFVTCAGAGTQISQFGIVLDYSNNQAQSLGVSNILVNGQKLTAVPEPGEIGLMGLGLLLIGGLTWRGRKSAGAAV